VPLDLSYMSDLGPAAIPALDDYLASASFASDEQRRSFRLLRSELAERATAAGDWREWTWREDRLVNYLRAHPFSPEPTALIE